MNLNKCAFPAMVLLRQDGSVQVAGDTHYQSCVNHLTFIQRLAMKTAESCSKKKVKKVQASQCRPSQVNCLDLSLARQKQGSPTLQNHKTYQNRMDSARFFFGRPYPPFYPFSTHVLPSFYPLHWHLSTGNFWLSSHCQEAQESRWPQWMILGPRVMR